MVVENGEELEEMVLQVVYCWLYSVRIYSIFKVSAGFKIAVD